MQIRDANEHDAAAIAAIYAHHVRHGSASFEEIPPDEEEMRSRIREVVSSGRPYIVAEREGRLVGYAYAGMYRARSAYRFTLEHSVYVDANAARGGIGSALMAALIDRCERGPWRQMIAVIGDSANAGSIALHRKFGFEHVGTFRNVGFKHGRWLDTVLMQKTLGAGGSAPPVV